MYRKKLKKIIYVLRLTGTFLLILNSGFYQVVLAQDSETVSTSVTVGNSAPSFTVTPFETPESSGTSPTDVGEQVTFQARGSDSNGDSYYLAICKGTGITANNNSQPTCTAGAWCVSDPTASGEDATCSHTALQGDAESNDWVAYVCDHNGASACSGLSTGSGDTGSPFKVNHPPILNTINNTVGVGGTDPGHTVTWTTNSSTLDNDEDTVADTITLVICKTAGLSGTACDGGVEDTYCSSSAVANNPSCSYQIPVGTADQSYSAYAYLFDNHGLGASANQETDSSYTVNNVAPVVSSVTVNGGSDITLTENTTTAVALTATITDNNGCSDLSSVIASLYRSDLGYSACDINAEDDDNNCYAEISCTEVVAGNTCVGGTDASVGYECTVNVQYHADPTTASTEYPDSTWKDTIKATDDDAVAHNLEVTTGVEMNTLIAFDVTASIGYGNLSVGQTNDMSSTTTIVTATGNVGLDQELSGTNMCTDYPGCAGSTIAVGSQKWALSSATGYGGATALTGIADEAELNCLKTTSSGTPQTKSTYWGLLIPDGTPPGTFTGENTITAKLGETANW
ncbi:hypothetical protein C4578_01385 [Candidatus Microgenomates bacterium]|jgi:hypothetical protein|nr:MAG: hypothetical protein C4578_01385 [Candidatus Microgenomates bacterium]